MTLPIHGEFLFEAHPQVIWAQVTGPWNLELVEAFYPAMAPYVQEAEAKGPWGLVVELKREAVCPPEALERIREGMSTQLAKSQRVCTAYVMKPDLNGYLLGKRIWSQLYFKVMPFAIFEQKAEAIAWAQQQVALSLRKTSS